MDAVTIYIAPFGAVLAAVILYWVLGLPAVKAELALGRKRPLGRGFDFLSKYVYVILTARGTAGRIKAEISKMQAFFRGGRPLGTRWRSHTCD